VVLRSDAREPACSARGNTRHPTHNTHTRSQREAHNKRLESDSAGRELPGNGWIWGGVWLEQKPTMRTLLKETPGQRLVANAPWAIIGKDDSPRIDAQTHGPCPLSHRPSQRTSFLPASVSICRQVRLLSHRSSRVLVDPHNIL
jgi:hypothetical protein